MTNGVKNGAKKKLLEKYELRLYVSGSTEKSLRAIKNLREICEEYLLGRYDLKVIDIYQQPALAKGEQIIAVPTLIKLLPGKLKRFIGDLSDRQKVIFGLDIIPI